MGILINKSVLNSNFVVFYILFSLKPIMRVLLCLHILFLFDYILSSCICFVLFFVFCLLFVSSYLFVDTLYLSHRFVRFLIYIFIILFLMFLYYVLLCCLVMWIMCSPSYLILHLYTHRMFLCAIEK